MGLLTFVQILESVLSETGLFCPVADEDVHIERRGADHALTPHDELDRSSGRRHSELKDVIPEREQQRILSEV